MKKMKKFISVLITLAMVTALFAGLSVPASAESANIRNDSLSVNIGDLGQIEVLNVLNNRPNEDGNQVNFVLPNNTSPQNSVNHQWMGELIFSYRTSEDGTFPEGREGFVEVDTNKTMAAGGSTTYSDATQNLAANPYIKKNVVSDKKVEIDYIGHAVDSEVARAMKGFNAKSVFDMDTEDGSLLWSVTIENTSEDFMEFGDVGLPMPWNNKYTTRDSVYKERVTAHTFAGADSGYAYAIRCSGAGNYVMFTPVIESGARIEYVDQWMGSFNEVDGERNAGIFNNWRGDSGGWQPGLSVYYVHSKDISKTGRGYYTDTTSLVLEPGASKTYQFKFSAVRGGDGTAQESADSPNNSTNMMEERESNLRSILYKSGMVDAIAVPSFQTAINMPAKLALHYDSSKISDVVVDIQDVAENDPFDLSHIPLPQDGRVNNARTGRGLQGGNPGYEESVKFVETKVVDGEEYHIYELTFDTLGNNSVRVDYKFGEEKAEKFTQFEFNVLAELDATVETHADFMLENQADDNPDSATFGIYSDWYFASGIDTRQQSHWGDDWSHDNANFMSVKNYLMPDPAEIASLENYLINFMWEDYMRNSKGNYHVANFLRDSGIYGTSVSPYSRTFSEMMECVSFFNMYRIQKAYPDLMEYRETPEYYLEKAYGIYFNRVGSGTVGFYGEQQVPDIIEALYDEGMTTEANNLKQKFARTKGRNISVEEFPYGSEFVYDNTGEEGAFAALKALYEYYPDDDRAALAKSRLSEPDWKSRAMRGIQPTWYHYGVPVFIGGEGWWNFQYTASLAGSILDDNLRYEDNGYTADQGAWAQRVSYAAKLSNFNAVNMGQIDDDYVGNVSWRYSMFKGGRGAMDVNDGGTRVMNNGWNDFSGESDEGLYGSLLRISADVVNDPIFGLFGYGANVTKADDLYTVTPVDGIGKRINLIDEKVYVETEQDKIASAVIAADGSAVALNLENILPGGASHLSKAILSGAGMTDGFYGIKVNGEAAGQVYIYKNEGEAFFTFPAADTAVVVIERMAGGENAAPVADAELITDRDLMAIFPFSLSGAAYDDGAPTRALTYAWGVSTAPEGGAVTYTDQNARFTGAVASLPGDYVLTLTAGDGELSTVHEIPVTFGQPPERELPVIGDVTAVQETVNKSVVTLSGSAAADPVYGNEATYAWSVVSKPEGSTVVIADAEETTALLKVSMDGEYVVRLTATDVDKSAVKDVTVTVSGGANGLDRGFNTITKPGDAPVLPERVSVITAAGEVSNSRINWDAVDPALYAETNAEFDAQGTVNNSEQRAAVRVYVKGGSEDNLALEATPTASTNTPGDLGGVDMLNNNIDPNNSGDFGGGKGAWHNWHGDQGGVAWIQYTWEEPVLATSMDIYVMRDGNGNFQPEYMKLTMRDSNGVWYTPRNIAGLGNALDTYNFTSFEPNYITAMRVDMMPVTVGSGILEWKVYGYTDVPLSDKEDLRSLMTSAGRINDNLFEDDGIEALEAALAAAGIVSANREATQEEVDAAYAALDTAIDGLLPINNNYAFAADVSTSFVSTWESLPSVSDNVYPADAVSNSGGDHYGSWGNRSAGETITYTWRKPVVLTDLNLLFWTDEGGIRIPASYGYEYLNLDGEWTAIPNADGLTTYPGGAGVMNRWNNMKLAEPIIAGAVRVYIAKPVNNTEGIGVYEWQALGSGYYNPAAEALVSVNGTESVATKGAIAEYVISGENMPAVSGVEMEFEIDGAYLKEKEITPVGFTPIGGTEGSKIYWRTVGDKTVGKVALVNAEGVSGDTELLKMVFDVTEGIVGTADVKLNYVKMSYEGKTVNANIAKGVQTTEFVNYFSPYDVNRDDVVDLNDITYTLTYFMLDEGSAEWAEAKICDVNADGVINISDLVLILENYTVNYYED